VTDTRKTPLCCAHVVGYGASIGNFLHLPHSAVAHDFHFISV